MSTVDRKYVLSLLHTARDTQEGRASLFTEKAATKLTLEAETRSYSVALLIDAIKDGLLEQLHAEAEQRLFLDMVNDQDDDWAAYMAGMGATPLSTTPLAIAFGAAVPSVPAPGDEFVPEEYVGPTGIGSSTPGGAL